jgi:hypothetical protein
VLNGANLKALKKSRLNQLEEIIERGKETFVEVGLALLEIRDKRLYKESYSSFDSYCRERWGYDRTYAHRLIDAADTAHKMLPIGNISSESQARELAPLMKEDEQEAVKVWRDLKNEYGDKVTAGHALPAWIGGEIHRPVREFNRPWKKEIPSSVFF